MLPERSCIVSTNLFWLSESPTAVSLRNHQAGALKCRDPERFSNRLSLGRIEVDSPNIEKAPTARNEVNRLAIGRPARLIVPILAFGNRDPRPARSGYHK